MIYGVESNIRRTIQLIQLLYYSKRPLTKEQILIQLEISQQTLNKDIKGIHETMTGIAIFKENKELRLEIAPHIGIKQIYAIFLGRSVNLKFLYRVLLMEFTVAELAENLFISESKVRELIKNWNVIFESKQFEVKIVTDDENKLIVLGDEGNIHKIFYQIITGVYRQNFVQYDKFRKLYTYYEQFVHRYLPGKEGRWIENTAIQLFFSLTRFSRGCYFKDKYGAEETRVVENLVNKLGNEVAFRSLLIQQFSFEIATDQLVKLFPKEAVLMQINPAEENHSLIVYSRRQLDAKMLYVFVESFLLHLNYQPTEEVVAKIAGELWEVLSYQSTIPFLFFNSYHNFCMEFNFRQAKITELLIKELNQFTELHYLLDKEALFEEFFYRFHIILSSYGFKLGTKKKVLLISRLDDFYIKMMQNHMMKRYSNLIDLEIYKEKLYNIDFRQFEEADVIITDLVVPEEQVTDKIVYCSEAITNRFWQNLETKLYL